MRLLDLTLETAEENLALDEALLDEAEAGREPREVLRIWESPRPLVVLGRSSQVSHEVELAFCRQQGIPVLRRASGGAAIVAGPGSLMYAVVLSYDVAARAALDRRRHTASCSTGCWPRFGPWWPTRGDGARAIWRSAS